MNFLVVTSILLFSLQSISANTFPQKINLTYTEPVTKEICYPNNPESITYSLNSINSFQEKIEDKKNKKIQDFLKSLGKDAKIFSYHISTPGISGGEYIHHKKFAQLMMDKLKCNQDESSRQITSSTNILLGSKIPSDLMRQAQLTNDFFQELFGFTRALGQYDLGENPFPNYYPIFKDLNRYTGFKCFKTTDIDEDGVHVGDNFEGAFIGDEVDFSPDAKLPSVGCLGNDRKIGFLLLIKK